MSRRSISIARSQASRSQLNFNQAKSEQGQDDSPTIATAEWFENKFIHNVNQLISSLPQLRSSMPYRLIIQKISNISLSKKSASQTFYLRLMLSFVTSDLTVVGKTCYYQCQSPVKSDGKFSNPICFYYHSRIDKAYSTLKLIIRFDILNSKDGIIQGISSQGITVIDSPFEQAQVKNATTKKDCSQLDLITKTTQNLASTGLSFSYHIESTLQLKNIIKFIPSETIVSSQVRISGILSDFPPDSADEPIEEQNLLFVNVKVFQIHIPQKFEQAVLSTIKNLNLNDAKNLSITDRKIVCGFHNEYKMVFPTTRTLQFIGKQATGEAMINGYEALSDQQIMKLPYYIKNDQGPYMQAIAISLVYYCGQKEYQVAMFAFEPNLDGKEQQISESMISGSGIGLYSTLLPVKTNKFPTIVLQYQCHDETKKQDMEDQRSPSGYKLRSQYKLALKQPRDNIESSKLMEELQRQRLNLEREKAELDHLKTQNYINYQQDFERKLEEEREQLRIRQQMIENQYREEVEKQIRYKIDLENQLRAMKEKITMIEKQQMGQNMPQKLSYEQTPAESESFYGQPQSSRMPAFRQKVNPNYLVQQEKTIPINEVRDIMSRTLQVNRQAYEKQLQNFNVASKFTFIFNSVVWSNSINPPKSFYLLIKFFNFKQFVSDSLGYISSGQQYSQLIRLNSYNYNLENTSPCYEFIVDPSQYAKPELVQEDLVNFLTKNNTIIDIFDAQNFLYIGQINIRMNELFKGAKSQVMVAKEYNMVRLKSQQIYGVIQILIKNESIECKEQVSVIEKRVTRETRKKVVSNNPIHINKEMLNMEKNTELVGGRNQAKNRQEKRIEMYKKKAIEEKSNKTFDDFQAADKHKLIAKINDYKQKKMPELIKKIYEDLLTQTITINPYFGQAETLLYQFTNMSQSPSSFRISIQDEKGALTLVKNSSEWKYFVLKNRYPVPKLYDCINDEDSFYLSPGETIPLVFKYLSFDKQEHSTKKTLTVTITKQENNWIAGGFTLYIESHESVINHSYILYQPGGQMVDLIIPVVYSSNQVRTQKRLFLTIEGASSQWINEYEILLRIRTPEIMSKLKFNMLLYEDDYLCELKQNWQIQLYSYEGVYAVSRPDEKTKFKISIPEYVLSQLRPARVNFFSSHPELIFEYQMIEEPRLSRGSVQNWCQLFPGVVSTDSIQITCVTEKKQLLYGWIVQIYPYTAKIS